MLLAQAAVAGFAAVRRSKRLLLLTALATALFPLNTSAAVSATGLAPPAWRLLRPYAAPTTTAPPAPLTAAPLQTCHAARSAQWAVDWATRWYGPRARVGEEIDRRLAGAGKGPDREKTHGL